jgi:hypothetical protein
VPISRHSSWNPTPEAARELRVARVHRARILATVDSGVHAVVGCELERASKLDSDICVRARNRHLPIRFTRGGGRRRTSAGTRSEECTLRPEGMSTDPQSPMRSSGLIWTELEVPRITAHPPYRKIEIAESQDDSRIAHVKLSLLRAESVVNRRSFPRRAMRLLGILRTAEASGIAIRKSRGTARQRYAVLAIIQPRQREPRQAPA